MSEDLKEGDWIRTKDFYGEVRDYKIEKFRNCLGIFENGDARKASKFTPLCYMYSPAPDAKQGYISNYGEYYDKWVADWMNIPTPKYL